MENVGIQFCFYPFLVFLGLISLLCGFVHVFLCLPFYFLAAGILNGVLLLVLTFHGCFLTYPTRGHCGLHCAAAVSGLVLAVLASLELLCIADEAGKQAPINTLASVCYGVRARTAGLTESCYVSIGSLRHSVTKLFGKMGELNVHRTVTGCLAGVGLVEAVCCAGMGWFCALDTGLRPKAYHAQVVLGLAVGCLGCLHTLFCCQYFYVGFAIWAAALVIVQALLTMRTKGHGRLSRSVNLLGAGLGMALAAINGFGLFCWFEGLANSETWGFKWHCVYRRDAYQLCERRIHFAQPYDHWPKHIVRDEIRHLQFVAYVGLIGCGLVQLLISLHSMFRKIRGRL